MSITILAYALWIASGALSLWAILLLRPLLLSYLPTQVFQVNPWALGAIDKFGTVVLGLFWLIFIVASEPYFHRLIERDLSIKEVVRVFLIEIAILIGVYGVRLLI